MAEDCEGAAGRALVHEEERKLWRKTEPMAMKLKIKIENLDREVEAEVGDNLGNVLRENNLLLKPAPWLPLVLRWIPARFHSIGLCETCEVEVLEGDQGLSDKGPIEKVIMKGDRRLACQVRVYHDLAIRLLHPAEAARF